MLRLLLTPRWVLRFAVGAALAALFALLGSWQLDRARAPDGRGLNWGYAVEWWLLAGFVLFCLWRWAVDTHRQDRGRDDGLPPVPDAPPLPGAPSPAAWSRRQSSSDEPA